MERDTSRITPTQTSKSIARFEELDVWQTSRELVKGVYRACATQQLGRDYALSNQMRRAAISVSSNIAEGFERGTRKQQIEFCYIAKGSAGELRCQAILARDLELISDDAYEWLTAQCEKCSRQLQNFIRHLRNTRDTIPGPKYA